MHISSYQASVIVTAAVARACDLGVAISIAVVDLDAETKVVHSMDRAQGGSAEVARGIACKIVQSQLHTGEVNPTGAALRCPAGELIGAFALAGAEREELAAIIEATLAQFHKLF